MSNLKRLIIIIIILLLLLLLLLDVTCLQWRRSVVKSEGVRVTQVKPSN